MTHQHTIFSSLTAKLKNLLTVSKASQAKISDAEYTRLVESICKQIKKSNWRPSCVVGITRGGLLPAVMISHYFDVKMYSLDISLRDDGECTSNLWLAEEAYGYTPKEERDEQLHFEISGIPTSSLRARKDILIVDDINDQGATLNWLMEDWRSGCLPSDPAWESVWNNNVKFAVVVNNAASKCNVKMDFVGKTIDKSKDDSWIVFPYEAWWK